jgi:glyoxylase-like metal-dependent hydrolase (beta-lactamase superfamily II)
MIIQSFVFNKNQVNTYIVSDEITKEAMIIDCGCTSQEEFNKIVSYVNENKLSLKYSFCTHLHFDHMFGINYIYDKYHIMTKACILDYDLLEWNKLCCVLMGLSNEEKELLSTEHIQWIEEPYEKLMIGDNVFSVIPTPGHSPGSISFHCESKKVIFCGDVLFKNGQGRTDFDGGDSCTLKYSIEYILNLDKDTLVLPGHYQPFRVKNRLPCNLATKK